MTHTDDISRSVLQLTADRARLTEALTDAKAKRLTARERLDHERAAVDRAKAQIEAAEVTLARLSAESTGSACEAADRLRAGETLDGLLSDSAATAARLAKIEEMKATLVLTREAAKLLDGELIKAQGNALQAEGAVNAAARDLLALEGVPIAEEIVSLRRRLWDLEDAAKSLSEVWLSGAPGTTTRPLRTPETLRKALEMVRPQRAIGDRTPRDAECAEWKARFAELIADEVAA